MKNVTRRNAIATGAAAGLVSLSTSHAQAADKEPTAQEIRDLMKQVGNFAEKDLEGITEESVGKARKGKAVKKLSREGEHDVYAQLYQGTGFFIDKGVWRWMGPGCLGNDWYWYNPKPGAYYQGVGQCTNGRYLTNIYCVF
jgi:hypothetical protein